MPAIANIYKSVDCIDAYSKDGTMLDPIFGYPDYRFDGDDGQTRDIELFLRNDGSTELRSAVISCIDLVVPSETSWMKLATLWADLDSATPGGDLSVSSDLAPGEIFSFWYRCTVPPGTSEQRKQDLALKIAGESWPVI